jgi:SAM-dependent methyltransferase
VDLERWQDYSFASRKLPENMHFGLILCPECDLLYADPIPALGTLVDSYRESSYDSAQEARYASYTYSKVVERFLSQLPDRDSALDVGAGDGAFLERLLELGFNKVVGVEPSRAPIEAAKSSIRPRIREGIFRASDFEPESFTLISCFQTMEHLHSPLETCQDFFRLLKPGGVALFVFHNRLALSAKILGLRSPIYDVEHMQLFSRTSMRNLLQRCGFRDWDISSVMNRYPLAYWARLFPLPAWAKTPLLSMLNGTAFGKLPIHLPAGNLAAFAIK